MITFNPKDTRTGWIDLDNTSIFMELRDGLIPEWTQTGHVVLRKIYEELPEQWYAYSWYGTFIDSFEKRSDAKDAVDFYNKKLVEDVPDED